MCCHFKGKHSQADLEHEKAVDELIFLGGWGACMRITLKACLQVVMHVSDEGAGQGRNRQAGTKAHGHRCKRWSVNNLKEVGQSPRQ